MATTRDHQESLKKSSLHFGPPAFLVEVKPVVKRPSEAADFEESVIKACDFVIRQNARTGKIGKKKKTIC